LVILKNAQKQKFAKSGHPGDRLLFGLPHLKYFGICRYLFILFAQKIPINMTLKVALRLSFSIQNILWR
jgi:hypothetical protein